MWHTNKQTHSQRCFKVSLQLRITSGSNGQNVEMYSTEGNFPSKDVFHQRLFSIKGGVPSDVYHKRLSPIKGCLPSKVVFHLRFFSMKNVFHQRLSSNKGHLQSKVYYIKCVFHQWLSSVCCTSVLCLRY